MSSNFVTVPIERYEQLVIAERDANALKEILRSRKYRSIEWKEIEMLREVYGITENEEES